MEDNRAGLCNLPPMRHRPKYPPMGQRVGELACGDWKWISSYRGYGDTHRRLPLFWRRGRMSSTVGQKAHLKKHKLDVLMCCVFSSIAPRSEVN